LPSICRFERLKAKSFFSVYNQSLMFSTIQAVIFDMDGLMLDSETLGRQIWSRALAERGYALADGAYLRLIGRTLRDVALILGEVFGADFPFDEVYAQRQRYYEEHIARHGIPLKPGLLELLDFLDQRGIPRAVASSTRREFALLKLSSAGVLGRFNAVACGDEVVNGKPAPDVFLEAARRLGIPPQYCLALEDSEAGVRAAHAAGMVVVMIPDLKPPTAELERLAYRILSTLADVIPLMGETGAEIWNSSAF
jgi:HAD superfamily hydrolase (TIGR01509 family)